MLCNASPLVPPWQGREGRLGTNPICMAVPGGEEPAWLLDMATTTVAANKIFKAFNNQTPSIPAGWAMDKEGVPTTSTDEAYHGLLMPLGGYKGSGLAVMVEILCAVLSGSAIGTELGGIRFPGKPVRVGQFYLAIDVARFMPARGVRRPHGQADPHAEIDRAGERLRRSPGCQRSRAARGDRAPANRHPDRSRHLGAARQKRSSPQCSVAAATEPRGVDRRFFVEQAFRPAVRTMASSWPFLMNSQSLPPIPCQSLLE